MKNLVNEKSLEAAKVENDFDEAAYLIDEAFGYDDVIGSDLGSDGLIILPNVTAVTEFLKSQNIEIAKEIGNWLLVEDTQKLDELDEREYLPYEGYYNTYEEFKKKSDAEFQKAAED